MVEHVKHIAFQSPKETRSFARSLANQLRPGSVILLEGDIGAGKTHFARSLIQALIGGDEDVPSPTFTLVQAYDAEDFEIWHADLYRLSSPEEVIELGLVDAFEDALCLVEWPDRLAELRPDHALSIHLTMTQKEGERQAAFRWNTPNWTPIVERALNA